MSSLSTTLDMLGVESTAVASSRTAKRKRPPKGAVPSGSSSILLPVPPFDADLLPDALRPWVVDVAERMQCPIDFPAVGAMIVLAAVVGRKVGICPKMRDAWLVIANLWGLLIGRPGIMKSPPLKEILKPLHRLEALAATEYAEEARDYEGKAIVAAARKKAAQAEIEKAVKRGGADPDRMAAELLAEDERPPTRRRYIVNDSTVEKMGIIMNENPNGVLAYRDELQGLLRSLDKPGREDSRAFYLECWSGDSRFTCDRVVRGTLDIDACCLSIIGTMQPGPLQSYQFSAAAGGQGDDGLLQRFQLAVWPDVSQEWVNVDKWPDKEARDQAFAVVDRLANLDPWEVNAQQDDHDSVPFLRFDAKAQGAFDAWRADFEPTVRTGTLAPALESVLAKYRSLIPSIALLCHLADGGRGSVPITAMDKAVGWGQYLFGHAQRIYSTIEPVGRGSQEALLDSIRQLGGRVTARDLRHHGFSGDAEVAQEAIEGLVRVGAGTWQNVPPGPKGGRPTCAFVLNTSKTKTETPSKPEENVGFGFGADTTQPDINAQLQEAAVVDGEEVGAW